MLEILNEEEKEVAMMLMRGQNANGIMDWLEIDYKEYSRLKKSLLNKLKIKRITQILSVYLAENGTGRD